MPFLAIIIPQIPADSKDEFLAHWPTVAAAMKAQPTVLGVSGGPIVAADGQAVTDFQFLQCLAFATLDDHAAFSASDFVQDSIAKYEAKAAGPAITALFEVADFPSDPKPKDYTQFSRITMSDESKGPEIREAWKALVMELGKETWGGVSVGDGDKVGLGLIGWDNLEEAGEAFSDPKAVAAKQKWESFGAAKSVMVKMQTY